MESPRNETLETTIDGFEVELELFEERGEQRSYCTIMKEKGRKSWSSSLHMAESNGYLDSNHSGELGDEEGHPISQRTINKIEDWATENGY